MKTHLASVNESIPPRTAVLDLLIVVSVLVIVKQIALLYSTLLAGPISTLCAMIVASYLLYLRKDSWWRLGLRWPSSWSKTIALTLLTFVIVALVANAVKAVVGEVGSSGRFDHIQGNLGAYLAIMLLVWTHGSVFEELLFRAFIITRGREALNNLPYSGLVAAILASLFFGYRHYYYQGLEGAILTGSIGFTFSVLYLWFGKRNIAPLILAHGLINSISQTQRFLEPF